MHILITTTIGTCMHIDDVTSVFSNSSLFPTMYNNGYATGMFGKLTNNMGGYFCIDNPKTYGFSRIQCPCDFNDFFGVKYMNKYDNGTITMNNFNVTPSLYETAMVGNASINWIESILASNSIIDSPQESQPFIAYIGSHNPHFPYTPAPWYGNDASLYPNIKAPRTETFNINNSSKYHGFVGANPNLDDKAIEFIDKIYKDRMLSLLSIDDIINDLIKVLEKYNALNNTYIVYTSDHGYHLGQLRVPCCKKLPYETDIRVPLYIRGPILTNNDEHHITQSQSESQEKKNSVKRMLKTVDIIAGNVDIAPTIYDLAGIDIPSNIDGKSMKPFIVDNGDSDNDSDGGGIYSAAGLWRDQFLIQYRATTDNEENFSLCKTWEPSNSSVYGKGVDPPSTNSENGEMYLVDNVNSNNWRELRILNETHNWAYIEVVNHTWDEDALNNPYFFELYDLSNDEWNMYNIYDTIDDQIQQELHQMLKEYGTCAGQSQCP